MTAWLLLVAAFLLWPGFSSQNECEEPNEIDFGEIVSIEKAKYLENDRVQYRCNPGYVLEGPEWIQCKGEEWTPRPPKCLVPCSITRQQLAAKNLFVFGNQRKARLIQSKQSLQFQCNVGYVLVVPSIRKCVDGYMDLPICISERGKNCSGPPRTENGDITTLSEKLYKSGSSIEFRCQKYYAMEGQNRSFCDNGTWTKVPICLDPCMIARTELESQKIEVKDEIDAPENIFVQHGHSIELTCRTGYVLAANSSQSAFVIHCDGKLPEIPKCEEITCKSPRISNGTFRPQRTIYHDGDLIRIQCDSGFTFEPDNGEKVVECTKNGWSPPPKCIKNLCPPPEVMNGQFLPRRAQYAYHDEIETICNEGFVFGGPGKVSKCTASGWNPPTVCKRKDCSYVHIENGRMTDSLERYKPFPKWEGETIDFRCDPGFLPPNQQSWQRVTCINSRFDPEPKCFKMCDLSLRFDHGRFIKGYWDRYILEGSNITFVCDTGYSPENQQSTITCTKKGWSSAPRCILIDAMCPTPRPVENAEIVEDTMKKYLNGEKINYRCNNGFDISGSAVVTCTQNKWSRLPTCVDARCSSPLEIQNGQITSEIKTKYLPQEKVYYQCNPDYTLLGTNFITCLKKRWSKYPRCTDTGGKCGRPPHVENGDIVSSPKATYFQSESVTYQCQNFYRMEGSPRVTCQNGLWSQTPTCRVACTASEEDMRRHNIRLKWTRGEKIYSEDGNIVEFVCLYGYKPDPNTISLRVNCVDGRFDYPDCIPI